MKAKQRMTELELINWLEGYIKKKFEGNKAAAAKEFGVLSAELYETLGLRRPPSKKLLSAIGYWPDTVSYYVKVK